MWGYQEAERQNRQQPFDRRTAATQYLRDHAFSNGKGFDYTVLAILYAADHPDFTIHAVYAYLNDTIHISPEHIHRSILFCITEAWALGALDTNVRPKVEDFLRAAADWLLAAEEKYEKQQ